MNETQKMYSLVRDGVVVVGSVCKDIAEKWLVWQKTNGQDNSTIVEAFDFENEVEDDAEEVNKLIDEIYTEDFE